MPLSLLTEPSVFSYQMERRQGDHRWVGLIHLNGYPIAIGEPSKDRVEAECNAFNGCLALISADPKSTASAA